MIKVLFSKFGFGAPRPTPHFPLVNNICVVTLSTRQDTFSDIANVGFFPSVKHLLHFTLHDLECFDGNVQLLLPAVSPPPHPSTHKRCK